jgi:hypothetical protein
VLRGKELTKPDKGNPELDGSVTAATSFRFGVSYLPVCNLGDAGTFGYMADSARRHQDRADRVGVDDPIPCWRDSAAVAVPSSWLAVDARGERSATA